MSGSSAEGLSKRGVRAAVAVAEEFGLRFAEPVVLGERSNLLVHLRPTPVVARIATRTGAMRQGDGWLAREVAVAGYLREVGAPVIGPSLEVPAGPHRHDGFALTFWEYVEQAGGPLDATEAGRRLRVCHEALLEFDGALAPMAPLVEAENILDRLAAGRSLRPGDLKLLRTVRLAARTGLERFELPMQVVHGDAGLSNVLATTRGPLWNDWEDTFLGPRAWDLACLEASAPPFGQRDPELIRAARAGYGDALPAEVLDAYVAARRFQASVWGVVIGLATGDTSAVQRRLAWFRQ